MTDRIDISDPVASICEAFGIHPNNTASINIRPRDATCIVYKRNEDGSLYLDPQTDTAATDILTFKVRTA